MKRALIVGATAIAIGLTSAPAQAGNGGNVAAGIVGGLAVGTLLGAAVAQPRYIAPPPVYVVEPEPVYVSPPRCFWTRGEPVWDGYRGVWVRPRMKVCD